MGRREGGRERVWRNKEKGIVVEVHVYVCTYLDGLELEA